MIFAGIFRFFLSTDLRDLNIPLSPVINPDILAGSPLSLLVKWFKGFATVWSNKIIVRFGQQSGQTHKRGAKHSSPHLSWGKVTVN